VVQSVGRSIDKGVITEPTKTNAGRRAVDLDLDEGSVDVLRAHIGRQVRLPNQKDRRRFRRSF